MKESNCGESSVDSSLKLVNGYVLSANDIAHAVQIKAPIDSQKGAFAYCTAVWISHQALLTAAHCIRDGKTDLHPVSIAHGLGTGTKSVKSYVHPKFDFNGGGPDVAVVVFADNTIANDSSAYLSRQKPRKGDDIEIVGYGKFDHSDPSSGGVKRIGSNVITSVSDRVNFKGNVTPTTSQPRPTKGRDLRSGTGTNVLNSQGDSGGPMYLGRAENGAVIGVSSTVDYNPQSATLYGHYTNLLAPSVAKWLNGLEKSGVIVNRQ